MLAPHRLPVPGVCRGPGGAMDTPDQEGNATAVSPAPSSWSRRSMALPPPSCLALVCVSVRGLRRPGDSCLRSARPGRDSLVAHGFDSFGGTLIVVLLHVAVHGAKLHLPPEVDVHGALLHRGVDELVGWVPQLHEEPGDKSRLSNDFIYIYTTVQKFGVTPNNLVFSMKTHTFIYQINCKMNIKYSQGIDKVINNDFYCVLSCRSKESQFYFILPDRQRRCLALDFFRLEHTQVES